MEVKQSLCGRTSVLPILLMLLGAWKSISLCDAFQSSSLSSLSHGHAANNARRSTRFLSANNKSFSNEIKSSRRQWLRDSLSLVGGAVAGSTWTPQKAFAEDSVATATTTTPLEMKPFIDPQGLFALNVPKDFFTLRRTQKGDLPDAKTGKGRRGSSIFTAGNMAKAEVVAVERFPTRVLLEENGISSADDGDLSTFPAIGDAKAVANLIVLRRERDTQYQGAKVLDNIQVTPDGKQLTFRLKTEIEVQKPELLLEEYGVSRLFRVTVAKATLDSNDGNIMAVFASALEQDFNNGVDGPALEETVKSFQALNQANSL
jgi:hypothetical protein